MTKPFTVEQLRCLELSRIIREGLEGVRFDMCQYRGECGTAGCIGGHAVAVYKPGMWRNCDDANALEAAAAILLGLEHSDQMGQIFWPWSSVSLSGYRPCASDITPAMAADTLERFAMTGKVEWRR